jgi:hypothetical protein
MQLRQRRRRLESKPNGGNYQTKQPILRSRLDEQFVLELTIRFELSVPKGGFSWGLQASAGSSESLNVNFFINPPSK